MLPKAMLTVHDAADILQVRESTVRALINDKRLRAVKIGKEWRIAEADLEAFLNENANREVDQPEPHDGADSPDKAVSNQPELEQPEAHDARPDKGG